MGDFYYNLQGGLNTCLTPVMLGADTKKMYWADAFNVEPYKNQGITRQKGNQVFLDLLAKIPEVQNGKTVFDIKMEPLESDLSPVKPSGAIMYPKGTKNFVLALSDGRIFYFKESTGSLNLIYDFKREILHYAFEYFLDGLVILPENYAGKGIDGIYFNPENKIKIDALNFKMLMEK